MLPVFMVSLEPDTERRKALQKRFSEKYREFYHVKAVDGRKLSAKHYFTEVYPYFKEYNRLISPSELGCTLSHLSALKQFLDSGADRALIIEDDILGSDEDLDKIASISKIMPDNSLLICGGQIGIGARYLFGSFNASLGCYDVATFSHAHIYGTCCYVVTRKSAGAIVGCQRVMKTLADKWDFFLKIPT